MLRFALFLLFLADSYGRRVHKNHGSEEASFQDAVENIARASIEKVFNEKSVPDEASGYSSDTSKFGQHQRKSSKHHLKGSSRHIHKHKLSKAYSNEDQSLYESNVYQDLYRHLPILPMVPVPLFYEGDDYSGDEPELTSGAGIPNDAKVESNINETPEEQEMLPFSEDDQNVQPDGENFAKHFSKHKKKARRGKKHSKRKHVHNILSGAKLNKDFRQSLYPSLSKDLPSRNGENLEESSKITAEKVNVKKPKVKAAGTNTVKAYNPSGATGAKGSFLDGSNQGSTMSYNYVNPQQSNTVFNQGKNTGLYSKANEAASISNQNQQYSSFQYGNQLAGNQQPINQYQDNTLGGNYLGSSNINLQNNALSQLTSPQKNLFTSTNYASSQTNNAPGSQSVNRVPTAPQGGPNTCPGSCPPACAPKCSPTCCNNDYLSLANSLQSSCSPTCAPLYSPSCCSNIQSFGQPQVPQQSMPCSAACAPQYLQSCCSGVSNPSYQIPVTLPQSYCPTTCAPDYSSTCCGNLPSPPIPQQIPQGGCSQSCAPQYLPSCCNGALVPPSPPVSASCPSSCGPSYLPSCCFVQSAPSQPSAVPENCAPSCAPQYTPACCSSNVGYGIPSLAASPPPPPLQVRVGFKASLLQSQTPSAPCPVSCATQCGNTCPIQCCGNTKRSIIERVPVKMPQPSRPLNIPAFKQALARQSLLKPVLARQGIMKQAILKQVLPRPGLAKPVIAKNPLVKTPATRQVVKKAPVVNPNHPLKLVAHAPPTPLNWDKKK